MTKSSTGTLFVFLSLLVCYLPKMCSFDLYVIIGQTTPALQRDSTLGEFVFESFNILMEDETHQKSRYGHT